MDELLINFLKYQDDARLTNGDKWLVWDACEWVVYSHSKYMKHTDIIYHGDDLAKALEMMEE